MLDLNAIFADEPVVADRADTHVRAGENAPETVSSQVDIEEQFEERAAIMEYDAGLSRTDAEYFARILVFGHIDQAVSSRPRTTKVLIQRDKPGRGKFAPARAYLYGRIPGIDCFS